MTVTPMDITLLVDNAANPGLVAEHGLAMWIETRHERILFDTGQGTALNANADKLGIALEQAKFLILSHGHFDHTGGIAHVLRCNPAVDVFCHPGVVLPRYSIRSGSARPVQMPGTARAGLDKLPSRRMHWMSGPLRISPDIGLTGPIPRASAIEDTGGPFFLDPRARRKDAIDDDAAMWINTPQGLVICVGCCHAGLINTLRYVRRLSGVDAIRAVIGGLHLLQASPERLQWTLSALEDLAPAAIVACHCTGQKAIAAFEKAFNGRVAKGYAGMRLHFA